MTVSVSAYPVQSINIPLSPPAGPGPMLIRCVIPQADLATSVTNPVNLAFIEISIASLVQQNPGFVPQSFSIENRNACDMAVFIRNGAWIQRFNVRPGKRIFRSIDAVVAGNTLFDVSLQPQGINASTFPGANWAALAVSDTPINFYNYPQRDREEDLWAYFTSYGQTGNPSAGTFLTLSNNYKNSFGQQPLVRCSHIQYDMNFFSSTLGGTTLTATFPINNTNTPLFSVFVYQYSTPSEYTKAKTVLSKADVESVNTIVPPGMNASFAWTVSAPSAAYSLTVAEEILWPVQADNNFSSFL